MSHPLLNAHSTFRMEDSEPSVEDIRSLGDILRDTRNLSAEQVQSILDYQRTQGVRFGEAAIALGYATSEDVLRALAHQFNYTYGSDDPSKSNPELIALCQPFSQQAEAFRAIRAQILLRHGQANGGGAAPRRALAVASPCTGDGKTFFCANLAISLTQLGKRTLVIDADMRGPRLHEIFGIPNEQGLSSLLAGRPGEGVIKAVTGVPGLFVLPVGVIPPNPLELVESTAFAILLMELASKFEFVLVDTPAAQYGVDNAVVAARCGLAIVVARKSVVSIEQVRDVVETLQAANATIAGVVMNEF